ncbi:hypothetical protein UA08_09266 [Talaromyces atroroseus]|uniref:Rhodopsin domain-containing protein n=1 Tax=Talaromyces atroroseus TaxID=1441469 RepID=A0A1Q5Q6L7_TALAT|nr:hypothetical protein UA08_09266 [Talaromyces atroroseus]OKL55413.1 hypothetical protein UA08_09266 [Talaromyces atroroseus]
MTTQPTSRLQNAGIAIEIIGPVLALICVSLRLYHRLKTGNHGWDDAWIVVAMALSIALAVGSIKVIKLDYVAIHYWDVPKNYDPTPGLMWIYIIGAVYNPILAIVKQSVLIFLLRLASTKAGVRYAVWAVSAFNISEMIAVFFVVIFQCSPIASNWNLALTPTAKCINRDVFGLTTGGLTILTDLFTLAVPIYIFVNLKINRKTKLALNFVFLLGFAVTIVSIVRLYFLEQHLVDTNPDANYSLGFCVSSIECNLAIITACGPAMWPLLRTWIPRGLTGYRSDNNNGDVELTRSANRTPGSSATPMNLGRRFSRKEIKDIRGDNARGKTFISASRPEDSDEEVLMMHETVGIVRTTDYSVVREQERNRSRDAAPSISIGEHGSY